MIKITKTGQDVTYSKTNTQHTFELNGKSIRINEYRVFDPDMDNSECDIEIDEQDIKQLSDDEYEYIGENLTDILETAYFIGEHFDLLTEEDYCSTPDCHELSAVGDMCLEHYQLSNS